MPRPASRVSSRARSTRGAENSRLAKRTGRSPHRQRPGSISPLVTSGGPDAVVGDGGDQPVVLVAEVEAASRSVADRPVGRQRRERRYSEHAGDDVRTTSHPTPPASSRLRHGRPVDPEAERAHQHLGVEHRGAATTTTSSSTPSAVASARTGPASRDARIDCGSTRPTRPSSGSASRMARARNSAAASAYGPPPCRLAPPRVVDADICERNGGFPTTTSNRRRPQSNGEGVGEDQLGTRDVGRRRSRGGRGRHRSTSPADRGRGVAAPRPPGTARRRTPGRAPAPVGRPRAGDRERVVDRAFDDQLDEVVGRATRRPTACACAWSIPSSAHRERRVRCRAGPVPPFRP